ncbi:Oidioi.mRNA.OKI2018_I69.PAR.g12023.t1.cds [Oikopleura dioica]|uniref:Oidioi.mRNA.OKI2018_I69.PAR.g12023.t1.cds n=1 Tax=Oikopleura dioica TaxID=34765 RepID=A0ABN7S379_OIKDI|nr:Oidioi.mRNA.OKI2018_I69.PAR.g12023.t1.cds [Oikopleura dioica]
MSTHRLVNWAPDNNFKYTDLNRPKKEVYNARFLYHDSAHHGINRYPDRNSYRPTKAPFHTSSSSSFRTTRESRESVLSRKAPPKTQEYRFPNSSKTDIRGFDNDQRRDILMTPKTSETTIPVLDRRPYTDHGPYPSFSIPKSSKPPRRPQTEKVPMPSPLLRASIANTSKMFARSQEGVSNKNFTNEEFSRRSIVDTVRMRNNALERLRSQRRLGQVKPVLLGGRSQGNLRRATKTIPKFT